MSETGHGTQGAPTNGWSDPIHDLVVADVKARKALGVRKYGRALQAGNGRDHLKDLYEELLDAACYVRAELEEREGQR